MSSLAALRTTTRSVGKLKTGSTCFLLCDIQDRFRPIITNCETVIKTANFMVKVGDAMNVPIVCTEQYPKAFGHTIEDILTSKSDAGSAPTTIKVPTFEKKLFSMMTDEVQAHVAPLNCTSFVLFGIEAHVCVQQTALDLLEKGYDVHIIEDGVSSQSPHDRAVALKRLESAGCFMTTSQSMAFMLLQSADHPNFKTVSKLIADHSKNDNEFVGGLGVSNL
jgi:nicotinamidase-related amidase